MGFFTEINHVDEDTGHGPELNRKNRQLCLQVLKRGQSPLSPPLTMQYISEISFRFLMTEDLATRTKGIVQNQQEPECFVQHVSQHVVHLLRVPA